MSKQFFEVAKGLKIKDTVILSGAGAPDGLNDQADVGVGSIYTDTVNGEMYIKKVAGSGAANWVNLSSDADLQTELDATQTSIGLNADGTMPAFTSKAVDWTTSYYEAINEIGYEIENLNRAKYLEQYNHIAIDFALLSNESKTMSMAGMFMGLDVAGYRFPVKSGNLRMHVKIINTGGDEIESPNWTLVGKQVFNIFFSRDPFNNVTTNTQYGDLITAPSDFVEFGSLKFGDISVLNTSNFSYNINFTKYPSDTTNSEWVANLQTTIGNLPVNTVLEIELAGEIDKPQNWNPYRIDDR